MPRYTFDALTLDGFPYTATLEAPDSNSVLAELEAQQLTVLRLRRHTSIFSATFPRLSLFSRRVSLPFWRDWCLQLSQLLAAGIPLDEAVADLGQGVGGEALQGLAIYLRQGHTLSASLRVLGKEIRIEPLWIELIAAGEQAGQLTESLGQLVDHLNWQIQQAQHTRQTLLQPLLSGLGVMAAALFLLLELAPALRPLLLHQQVGWATSSLFWLMDGLQHYGLSLSLLAFCLGAGALSLYRLHPAWRLTCDRQMLHIPVLGPVYRARQLAPALLTVSMLYRHGLPILDALAAGGNTLNNRFLRNTLLYAKQSLEEGQGIARALQTSGIPLPHGSLRLLARHEKAGRLADGLEHLARRLDETWRQGSHHLHSLLQPGITLLSGAVLGWICLALLAPLYAQMGQRW